MGGSVQGDFDMRGVRANTPSGRCSDVSVDAFDARRRHGSQPSLLRLAGSLLTSSRPSTVDNKSAIGRPVEDATPRNEPSSGTNISAVVAEMLDGSDITLLPSMDSVDCPVS